MKCEFCGKKHDRKRFCSNKCKDRYHNKNNPRGYGLTKSTDNAARDRDMYEYAMNSVESGWDGHKNIL